MDSAAYLTNDIWVEAVVTVGLGVVEFTGPVGVGVVGIGWARTLTLYLLLASTDFLLLSFLGPGTFLVMELFWGGVLVLGCGWVGCHWDCCGWGLDLRPSLPSSSK